MVIDAHQHFWQYQPVKHAWIDDSMAVLKRDFLPVDLASIYQHNGIDGCVAVQADQSLEENDFLLNLANQHSFIKGIVGWEDFRAANIAERLESYKEIPLMKGFRHVVQAEADTNFLLRNSFMEGLGHLAKHGFTYDILVFPHQLGSVLELVRKMPNQKFVIDHLAKPYIKDGFFDGWATMMAAIAKYENVYCKMSGMITEANLTSWTPSDFEPYMQVILENFGAKRILFGSDWPVCLLAGNYAAVKDLVANFINTLSDSEQQAIWGGNAIQFYGLKI